MPDSGADLGADLFRLLRMAKANLPDIAAEYAAAAGELGQTENGLAAAFARPAQFGGAQGPAYGSWLDVRDLIKQFLSDTGTNLTDTSHALLLAVDAYSSTDAGAAAEFNRLKSHNGYP